jgi:ribosomal protein S18 acetylase RimI-like enzyme
VRGFEAQEEVTDNLPDGTALRFVRMMRPLTSAPNGRLRIASVTDAETIADVHVASWQSAYRGLLPDTFLDTIDPAARATKWRELFADPSLRVVLREVIGVGVVAFCAVGRARDDDASGQTMEIWNLHTAPASRGRGYGAQLFREAKRIARGAGADELTLWVVEENEGARRFYARNGMREDGARQVHTLAPSAELREVRYRMRLTNDDMTTEISPPQGERG